MKDEDLIAELRKRNTEKFPDSKEISYRKLKLDRRIELVDLDTLLTNTRFQRNPKILKCRAYFRMYAPGFSKDGNQALVRSVIGTSPHGATATWLLELHQGRWNVKWMEIAAYV